MSNTEDDVGIHLDKASVAIIGEALTGLGGEALHGGFIEAEVEDRIHHARHRGAGTGADGDQERVFRITKGLSGLLLQRCESGLDLCIERCGIIALKLVIGGANGCSDREARRHRQAQLGHLSEVCALAAQQVFHGGVAIGRATPKGVNPLFVVKLQGGVCHGEPLLFDA